MTLSRTQSKSARGFTLLELLIAVMAFAIVLVAINGVFYSALRLRNTSAASLEKNLPVQHALVFLRRDLANLVVPGGTLGGELQSVASADAPQENAASMESSSLKVSPDFYTLTGSVDNSAPWSAIQKVSYRLADSLRSDVGRDLVRAVTRNLLPPTVEDAPLEQRLLSGVEEVVFWFWDGTEWRDSWDSSVEVEVKLPLAIKVQIFMAVAERGQAQPAPVELVVPLVVEASTNQTANASGGQP